ncbi:MAG TPA: serine hydrolase [Candidatus Elarobacter sp.]|jgi:CubicO group peptidase (beta-lactamase class C family)
MTRIFAYLALLAAFALAGAAPTPATGSDDGLIGLWSYRKAFPTGLAGELAIVRSGARWHASIAGVRVDAAARGNAVDLVFPREGGRFRGSYERGVLRGFWVRRAVTEDPRYPIGEALSYTSPAPLRQVAPATWRATIAPLDDTFTLYLQIFRDEHGTLKAAFRNPEGHSHGAAMQFSVERDGEHVRFDPPANPASADGRIDATLMHQPERIAVPWSDMAGTVELTRGAVGSERFLPAPPSSPPYVYRAPAALGDGWSVARAGDAGMDEAALARVVNRIRDIDPASQKAWLIHSIAIAYRGRLVLDEYFYGFGRDEPHDTRSASKTFSSVILGALMRDGSPVSPATRVYDVMAPRGPFAHPDPRKSAITLGHVLTHSSGLACDDNADHSPGNEDAIEADRTRPDWVKVTLDLPMQYAPGTHYAYCSMNINLAGAVLSRVSGEWLPALFDRTVARPLSFGPYYWNLTGNGEGYLGGGVFVRTRDFLKLGQTYLDGGTWNGRRIVTEGWVKDSLAPHMHISPETTGLHGDAFLENYYDADEGWAWHMIGVKAPDRTYGAYYANGNGGQLLLVVPELDLSVMFTAGNYGQGLWNRERDDIVGGMIIPAIRAAAVPKPS